jgi:hypothetical protein
MTLIVTAPALLHTERADKPLKTTSTDYHSDARGATCPPKPPIRFT